MFRGIGVAGATLNAAHDCADGREWRIGFGDDRDLPPSPLGTLQHVAIVRREHREARLLRRVGLDRLRRPQWGVAGGGDDGDAGLHTTLTDWLEEV